MGQRDFIPQDLRRQPRASSAQQAPLLQCLRRWPMARIDRFAGRSARPQPLEPRPECVRSRPPCRQSVLPCFGMRLRYWHGLSAASAAACDRDWKARLHVSHCSRCLPAKDTHLFLHLKSRWVYACSVCIFCPAPLLCICSSQLPRALHLLRDVVAHNLDLGLPQAMQLAVQVLHSRVLAVAPGKDVGELAQCHKVAQRCGCQEEVAEQFGFLRRHCCSGGRQA